MFRLFVVFIFYILSFSIKITIGANILALMMVISPSHHIWNSALTHTLAEQGHNVTVLSVDLPKPSEKLPSNLHYIHLEEGYSIYSGDIKIDLKDYFGISPLQQIPLFYDTCDTLNQYIVKSKGLHTLLNYPDDFKFDLVLNDYTMGPLLLGFMHKFKYPPLIGMSAFLNPPITIDQMSHHYFPAYIPYHSTMYSPEMSFWQRLENTLIFIGDTAYRRLIFLPRADATIRPFFSKDMPYLGDISKHTAISLVNSHPAINYVEPLPPNIIEVGGMQIKNSKPLPKDLDDFMNDKSKLGTILISLGTNMKSEDYTEEQIRTIVNTMKSLPNYSFLWKFDAKYLRKEKLPENAIVRQFFPQSDILAHPKIKAFVTHCGGLSTQEAIWRGVPMVGVPLFFDQHRNLRNAMTVGVAEKLDFFTMTTESLRKTILKVLEDPQMQANIKAASVNFRDRPMPPLETAVWWVEYMLRNPKPTHLKSPAAKLNIFQANSLDCLLFILVVLLLVIYTTIKLLLFLFLKVIGIQKAVKQKTN
ncbi:UDP-glucosyltransferase 2-like [Eupeodes corollae]|uniref:UDP-glucosyltransferase 2-like n=1 Tax=Eupeodes corollae TaxID=290404 RepID=UPI00249002F5|nr:UDP-glucosyltransferase 2-like [Eupeodes corollae]